MSVRAHEWGERLSAALLLCASLLVFYWSRWRVAEVEAQLAEREREVQQCAESALRSER